MKKRLIASILFTLSLSAISSCANNNNQSDTENGLSVTFIKDEGVKNIIKPSDIGLEVGSAYEFKIELNDKFELLEVKANGQKLTEIGKNNYIFILKKGKNEVEIKTKGAALYTLNKLEVNAKNSITTLYENWEYPHFPSTGDQKLLVIPVVIEGYENKATEATRNEINKSFFGSSEEIDFESLASYYKKSSYGKLNISGQVTEWFNPNLNPDEILELNDSKNNDYGTYEVLNRAIEWVKTSQKSINLSDYDNNKDGYIDGVYLVYSAPTFMDNPSLDSTLFWNFTYYNRLNKGLQNVKNPLAMTYSWSSIDTMKFGYDSSKTDAHIFIHEFGHQLGLQDYYDVPKNVGDNQYSSPMGGLDMMDYNIADHSPYSKYALGWTAPKSVTGSTGSVTVEIEPFYKNGDFLLIAPETFNGLPFDEYFVVEYVQINDDKNNLNYYDSKNGYPINALADRPIKKYYQNSGIRVTHIDSRAIDINTKYTDNLDEMVKVRFNNTGMNDKAGLFDPQTGNPYILTSLISAKPTREVLGTYFVADDSDLFKAGAQFNFMAGEINSRASMLPTNKNKLNDGTMIYFNISIDSITDEKATITIS